MSLKPELSNLPFFVSGFHSLLAKPRLCMSHDKWALGEVLCTVTACHVLYEY